MKIRNHRELEHELARARDVTLTLTAALLESTQRNADELSRIRAELAELRVVTAERERNIARDALELLRDSGRQVGLAQQTAAALADSNQMLELAGDLIAHEAEAELATINGGKANA
jgi:hypothetical protein